MRPSSVPNLYACCLTKRSCHFCLLHGLAFAVDFAILRSHFWYRQTVPKNGTVNVLFFCSFTKLCARSQKWDRQAVPFLGPCLGSFFEVFCIRVRVAEAQRFGFNEALWLMATGRAIVCVDGEVRSRFHTCVGLWWWWSALALIDEHKR